MNKDIVAIRAWTAHLKKLAAKRSAADKMARKTRKAQRRAQ